MTSLRFSPVILAAEARLDAEYATHVGFCSAVHHVVDFLQALPQTFSFRWADAGPGQGPTGFGDPEWERAQSLEEFGRAGAELKALAYSSSYAVFQVYQGLIEAMNDAKYLLAIQCTRTLLEHAAYQNDMYERVAAITRGLDVKVTGTFYGRSLEMRLLLIKLFEQKRFDTAALGEDTPEKILAMGENISEDSRATNILTLIDKLLPEGKSYRVIYSLLSEYVHPNLGSRVMFYQPPHPAVSGAATGFWTVSSEIGRPECIDHTLAVISGPVVSLSKMVEVHTEGLLAIGGLLESYSPAQDGGLPR